MDILLNWHVMNWRNFLPNWFGGKFYHILGIQTYFVWSNFSFHLLLLFFFTISRQPNGDQDLKTQIVSVIRAWTLSYELPNTQKYTTIMRSQRLRIHRRREKKKLKRERELMPFHLSHMRWFISPNNTQNTYTPHITQDNN